MSESIISQLKEYATVIADDMVVEKTDHEFTEELQAAYQRAMDFSEVICPACWVKNNETSALGATSNSDTMESYRCEKCGFEEELAKEV
jgi:transposase-like protein